MPDSVVTERSSPKSFEVAAPPPAVECRGVVKRYYHYEHRTTSLQEFFVRSILRKPIHVRRARFQLEQLDLVVERGEAVALIGPNGSGKSTALRLIAGIYPPTEGTIVTRGHVVGVIELGASFHPDLTGAENVQLYASVLGLTRQDIHERYPEILSFAQIGDFIDVPLKYYSSGMRARLAFSVALCSRPDLLLLDEVMAVGDADFRHRCLERLRRFHEEGGTLIVVSHDFETLRGLCTRAVWLDQGRVRRIGPLDDVVAEYLAESPGHE